MAKYKRVAEAAGWPFEESDLITFLKVHTLSDAKDGFLKCLTCEEIINISQCMNHVIGVKHMDKHQSKHFTDFLSSHGIISGSLPECYFCRLCAVTISNRKDILNHIDDTMHQIEISMRNINKSKSDLDVLVQSNNFITYLKNSEMAKSENIKRIFPAIDKSLLSMENVSDNLKRFQDFNDRHQLDVSAKSETLSDMSQNTNSTSTMSVDDVSHEINDFFTVNSLKSVGNNVRCEKCNVTIAKKSLPSLLDHINGRKHRSRVFSNDPRLILSSNGIFAQGATLKCYYCNVILEEHVALMHILMKCHQNILQKELEIPLNLVFTYSSENDADPQIPLIKKFGCINKIMIFDTYYNCEICHTQVAKDADSLLCHVNGKKHTEIFESNGVFISFLKSHTIQLAEDGLFECFICKIIGMDRKLAADHAFDEVHVYKLLQIIKHFC